MVAVYHGGSSVWQREIPGKATIREQVAGLPRALHRFLQVQFPSTGSNSLRFYHFRTVPQAWNQAFNGWATGLCRRCKPHEQVKVKPRDSQVQSVMGSISIA